MFFFPVGRALTLSGKLWAHFNGASVLDSLVAQASAGDPEARGRLWQIHYRPTLRTARAILRNDADAEDVTAQLFHDFFCRHIQRLSGGDASVAAYLRLAVIRQARRFAKRARRLSELDEAGLEGKLVEPGDPLAQAQLERCMSQLSPKPRRAVSLRFGSGWNNVELADSLGVTKQAVGQLLKRARAALLSCLLQAGVGPA